MVVGRVQQAVDTARLTELRLNVLLRPEDTCKDTLVMLLDPSRKGLRLVLSLL